MSTVRLDISNMEQTLFPGRVGLQQRVLPAYRAPFFDLLAQACVRGLSVFAGLPRPDEVIHTTSQLKVAHYHAGRNFHFGKPSSPYFLCWQSGINRWLVDWQPDILVVEANPRYFSTRLGVNWMHRHGRPVIGWGLGAHQKDVSKAGSRDLSLETWADSSRKRFLRMFDGIIAYSQRGAAEYKAMGVPEGRVFIAKNAVTHRPSKPPVVRPVITGKPLNVLFVGRLQRRKRLDMLLHACASLPEDIQPDLTIIGDGPALGEFHSLAGSIYPKTQFLGARHGEALQAEFFSADIFVLPGTGGLAVQQAMAHGLPVIVAEGDGTQEDLVRPTNGWLLPANDQQALIDTLLQALSDVERLRQMGENSYRIVRDEANLEEMVRAFINALLAISAAE
jgi:glycosyltransferase involved in cell wall biosynthesis